MRICFIADANSIHTRRWVEYFCKPENEVFILSTVRNPEPMEGVVIYDLFTGKSVRPNAENITAESKWSLRSLLRRTPNNKMGNFIVLAARNIYENAFISRTRSLYRTFRLGGNAKAIVKKLQPDLVHCLRLPIEGYIGWLVGYRPLVISSWGCDFVLFANKYLPFRWLTKKALNRADVHFADNIRDRYLAEIYGFSPLKLTAEVPGWGGLKLNEFPLHGKDSSIREKIGVAPDTNLLLSPRGFISRFTDTRALILALPRVVESFPNTLCLLIGDMRSPGYLRLKTLVRKLKIEKYCRFINRLKYPEFLNHLAASDIIVSVSLYDGCSISMLEGMACGVIPIMSSDFPKKEWITDGWNGYLFNPRDPENIAQAIIKALGNKDNFEMMRQRNRHIVEERADYYTNMKVAENIYHELIKRVSTY